MQVQQIDLNSLLVNNANDRHGELSSSELAMYWLLEHRADHMRKLTADIVKSGGIYEPPLVHHAGTEFIVYDGNRRTTCLKLLNDPREAPDDSWKQFFQEQRSAWIGEFPTSVTCQIETDLERIDEILYRRHTGGQGGVGQSPWDPEAKSNFVKRTGKHTRINIAEEIELKLKSQGILDKDIRVPRSNLNRLLSSEAFRSRVGITAEKNRLSFTHDEGKVNAALTRIVSDLVSKAKVLDDIWSNDDKRKYLDELDSEGVLPGVSDALDAKSEFKSKSRVGDEKGRAVPKKKEVSPTPRKGLIRSDVDYGVVPQKHTQRCWDIWQELQHHLKFGEHNNAISVLFRVLLEVSINNYISQNRVDVHENDKLSKRYTKVLAHMVQNQHISQNDARQLQKFERSEAIFSANTLNAYVHDEAFFPSDHHLKSMFDTLHKFIVACMMA